MPPPERQPVPAACVSSSATKFLKTWACCLRITFGAAHHAIGVDGARHASAFYNNDKPLPSSVLDHSYTAVKYVPPALT
jgi:hypothetical protein